MSAGVVRVVVTGASGFVGRALIARSPRGAQALSLSGPEWRTRIGAASFEGATVLHLAARVHREGAEDESLFIADNVDKTRALADAAARQHARRFVFLSSIKVQGEETHARPFTPDDPAAPEDAYSRSKWAAEQALAEVSAATGLEVVIVRSPLVYGPGVGGNLRTLIGVADSAWPLPFGALDNRRSGIHVDDLARLLVECGEHPQAAGRTYLAAHPDSVSTRELVARMRSALGRPPRLVAVAPRALEWAASLGGQAERMHRLTRSLEIDASATTRDLGWSAAVAPVDAVDEMVRAYRAEGRA